ncbi:response regulator transcription factor [bacterium]|nr:response regulator transcription factor [bacterium]
MKEITIFLIDDNLYFLNAAIDFIETNPEFKVLGYSQKGEDAFDNVIAQNPDVFIIDYVMAGMNGIEVTRIIKKMKSPPIVIIVTQFDSQDYREQALRNGADGFVPKAKFGDKIIPLIRSLVEEKTNNSKNNA